MGRSKKNAMTASGAFKPFEGLDVLLRRHRKRVKATQKATKRSDQWKPPAQALSHGKEMNDEQLFMAAMDGVTPMAWRNCIETDPETGNVQYRDDVRNPETEDTNGLMALQNLVDYGQGFEVANTPEYIEGLGYHVHPRIARRLHRGDYSIQAHIDLHGLCVADAHDAFETFMKESIATGKRAVSVVHGRGLSSPGQPVLKNNVQKWLTHGKWRKWVIAFASARACDGGAGATYVLLRTRPFTKRFRKKFGK